MGIIKNKLKIDAAAAMFISISKHIKGMNYRKMPHSNVHKAHPVPILKKTETELNWMQIEIIFPKSDWRS